MFRALACAFGVLLLCAGGAWAQSDYLRHVAGRVGCAIGPEAKMAPHLPTPGTYAALTSYAEAALSDGQAKQQGEWIVLDPAICTIRLPYVTSDYDITSPVVQSGIAPKVANEEFQEFGCFITSDEMQAGLVSQGGLDADAAAVAYLKVLGEGVKTGRVTFFSDDLLRTPPGFQSLVGACAEVPQIAQIRRSQALFVMHFDWVVRENAKRVPCEENGNPVAFEVAGQLVERTGGEMVNAWVMMDLLALAVGADWIEDASATQRGTPRPPICSYVN